MKPPENNWPNSDTARGVLFFAQHMREMLTQSSFESFRVPTLDLISRLDELLDTIDEVGIANLPLITIEPVLKEVVWSLRSDPIAKAVCPGEVDILEDYVKRTDIRKIDTVYVGGLSSLLLKRIEPEYAEKLEYAILACYGDGGKRNSLRKICICYCSHLVNIGYHKKHLLESIENRFFNVDIHKIEKRTLQRFFSSITKEDRQFRVWVAAPATSCNFIGKLGLEGFDTKVFRVLPADVRNAFRSRPDFDSSKRYITKCIHAKDRYSAVASLYQLLSSIDSFVILGRDSIDIRWDEDAYVRTPQANSGEFISGSATSLQNTVRAAQGGTARVIRQQAKKAMTSFEEASTERLLSAVNTAALARTSPNIENHLISLWSAIEVLLSNPQAGVPRIVHYVDLLTPCICAKYVRRYLVAIFDSIRSSYGTDFHSLIYGLALPMDMDEHTKFVHLCFDPTFHDEQSAMMAMLSANPLALYRLWLFEKNFGNPKSYSESVKLHDERVRWQLHRIYRARNKLVHAGSVPVYLEPLVQNMLEYFRATIGPVISRASKETDLSDIDQMVTEIGIEYEITKRKLVTYGKPDFAPEDIQAFFK